MDRLARLADLFDNKYSVVKTAATPAEILERAKDDILTNYKHWVMGKYRALKILADHGEPFAKALYHGYNDLVANIDAYSPLQLFNRVNKILALIKEMKADPSGYRESIHGSVEVNKDSDRNYREQLKSGFETNLKNISFGLDKVRKVLHAFAPAEEMTGGAVEPQRKGSSREQILIFMKGPIAARYGLDDYEVMTEALTRPNLKEDITTLINGGNPSPGFAHEIRQIKQWLENREKTNLPALEHTPEKPAPAVSLFEEEGEEPK